MAASFPKMAAAAAAASPHGDARGASEDKGEEIHHEVHRFLAQLQRLVRGAGSMQDLQQLYDHDFQELSDKHFHSAPWPQAELVADYLEEHGAARARARAREAAGRRVARRAGGLTRGRAQTRCFCCCTSS
jgi:hypothetical protein